MSGGTGGYHWRKLLVMAAIGLPVLFGGLLVVTCISSVVFVGFEPQFGHCDTAADCAVSRVPDNATNIDYMLPGLAGPAKCYEFDTTEEAFLAWAEENEWSVEPVQGERQEIKRYTRYTASAAADRDSYRAIIERGYYYEWTESDQGVWVGYDLDTHRAYYAMNTR